MVLLNELVEIKTVTFFMFSIMMISACGYMFGKITIKHISLGTAGVFVVALIYGCLFYKTLSAQLNVSFVGDAIRILENLGLILFVSSVGFLAGPNFVTNLKKNFKSYVILGVLIIISGAAACAICILIERNFTQLSENELVAIFSGLFSGALTSTPAFSASKAMVGPELEPLVSVGYGIAYLFGVFGVVLFVQLVPKITKADIEEEKKKIISKTVSEKKNLPYDLIEIDDFGITPLAFTSILGIIAGAIHIGTFSLTTTGGCLLFAILFGHLRHIWRFSVMPKESTLKVFRELGLMLFLIGAGISGGAGFAIYFNLKYFLYGIIMTLVPLFTGFFFSKYVLKIALFNNLGSITGGMTSAPALGALMRLTGTEAVASAYAATYPFALVLVVISSQLIVILFGTI